MICVNKRLTECVISQALTANSSHVCFGFLTLPGEEITASTSNVSIDLTQRALSKNSSQHSDLDKTSKKRKPPVQEPIIEKELKVPHLCTEQHTDG